MKNYLIFNSETNSIASIESRGDDSFPIPRLGFTFRELLEELKPIGVYYIKDNNIKYKPTQPDDVSVFNTLTEQWEYSLGLYADKIEQHTESLLSNRLQLLQASDWTDTVSAQTRLGDLLYQAWQDYRQALRDITLQANYPTDVIWPIAPL